MSFSIIPPPTSNKFQTSQRIRLRKSSRKLEALLGTTPLVIEVNKDSSKHYPPTPATPRTKARRRQGWLREPTICTYSSDSDSDADTVVDIVLSLSDEKLDITPRELPPSLLYDSLPRTPGRRARGKSVSDKPKYNKTKPLPETPRLPSPASIDLPLVGKVIKPKKSFARPLAQPILVAAGHRESIISITSISNENEPLSPLFPGATVFNSSKLQVEDREREARRKKLAKLTRTLGENVPPELVFRPFTTTTKERRSSNFHPKVSSVMKPLSHVNAPSTSTFAPSSSHIASPSPPKVFRRAHRPRSLSVPSFAPEPSAVQIVLTTDADEEHVHCLPPFVPSYPATVGRRTGLPYHSRRPLTDFLDSPRGGVPFEGLVPRPSLDDAESHRAPSSLSGHFRSNTPIDAPSTDDVHRRKEREWSGEWNVTDMGDVMKRLRELKGR